MKKLLYLIIAIAVAGIGAISLSAAKHHNNQGNIQQDDSIPQLSSDTVQVVESSTPAKKVITDDYVMLPEAILFDIDSLLNEYHAKKYLKAFECDTSDTSPLLCDSDYIERLDRLPAKMELVYNDIVRSVIDRYAGRLRRTVSFWLGASNFYFPIFEEALEKEGMPLELRYLPVIESALRPQATSKAGAAGLWQFMVGTGKQMGLTVNTLVDERRDPFKSTYAAVKYLKELYSIYGDWSMAIAAYNCGPGNVNKAIRRADGVRDYWEIYPYLPRETRGYVPAFIAAAYIMNYYCEHKICPMRTDLPIQCDTIMTNRNISLRQISEFCGMDMTYLKMLNPQYRTDLIPGESGPYSICLPLREMTIFIDNEDSIYKYKADEYLYKRRVVKPATGRKRK